ncbi:hypothetical protein HKBW3S43_00855 [Candidatus Hakubella thermalkaliphila]|uniref:Ribbon-helix-helix protein CopG domain-containing protein n=1 Tax=Candidatus Hakubella thermalkaliphila TaxID=2754717 RepID=A0A6V8P2N7_9ACTN|nr:ribbon-helix-helix protein, CopG family [Candidatus Hakubella thermalkaliphila]GFP21509.1 hypothetical protein HKBW3S06_00736 [Candidatus Hakubella thermalkaliphila]GFP25056.1 hypothetical protein HKBW3S25_00506 [Candidatus Hakubella thermalkaliphila]GFP28006.1 hypothetical protein HKBW3S33_01423 [Candidatus Hakubella thermalkaliphila]GFP35063.1 hypothetical protein HKBW3S43_00855 [Candidatus Hakubella thermalkaliphila]GFP44042.1 hypothetical protein HKBW3C_03173 [Candidatus Hakubella therm
MRTTIDIPDEQRAELLSLAAKRGLRGYSDLVREAVELYLARAHNEEKRKEKVLALEGIWAEESPEQINEAIDSAWSAWDMKEREHNGL